MKRIAFLVVIFCLSAIAGSAQSRNNALVIDFTITDYTDTSNVSLRSEVKRKVYQNLRNDVEKALQVWNGKCTDSVIIGTSCSYYFEYKCYNGKYIFQMTVSTSGAPSRNHYLPLKIDITGKNEVNKCLSFNPKSGRFQLREGTPRPDGVMFCYDKVEEPGKIDINGKVLMKKQGGKQLDPVKNQKVNLKESGSVVKTVKTDPYGDFYFPKVDSGKTYTVEVEKSGKMGKDAELFIAKTNGVLVKSMKNEEGRFVYEFLPADIQKLSLIPPNDPVLIVKKFMKQSETKEVIVVQNIYYAVNSFSVAPPEMKKLDTIAAILSKNPNLLLDIASFTDSRGDDKANLELSQKRAQAVADYMVMKGIPVKRLSAKGLGETKILNGCVNGVECSEKEHEINRRTEFKFTKM